MTTEDEAVHLTHCNQGEWRDSCKYGDSQDCPACWNPWDAMGIALGGYNSEVDDNALAVLRAIRDGVKRGREGGKYGNFVTEIVKVTGLNETHVELWQYIFCSAGWCDYGTSPRGCFPDHGIDFDELIVKWERYYQFRWNEKE